MESKLITVPFDVLKAKAIQNGELEGNIVTRDGRNVRILCFNRRSITPIVALIENGDNDECVTCRLDGRLGCPDVIECLYLQLPEYTTFKEGDVIEYGNGNLAIFKEHNFKRRYFKHYALLHNGRLQIDEGPGILYDTSRLASDEGKRRLENALKSSEHPKAEEYLKRFLGVEVNPKFEFTTGQPVVGMKQHMIAKVESAKEYTAVIVEKSKERHKEDIDAVMKLFREGYVTLAFEAGWDAAVNYLAKLPFDKILEYFNEALEDVTMEEVIEENKDVLKRLKNKSI